jgi:hypothetical protein
MTLPTWVTVLICNIVAGVITQRVDALLVLPFLLGDVRPDTLVNNVATWLIVGALVNAVITALLVLLLLPAISSLRTGFGTAFIASLVGQGVVFVGTILLLRATVRSSLAAGGGIGLMPAVGGFTILFMAVGVWLTATIINSSASAPGGGGGRLDLYGGQAYLDEYRKGES